MKIICFSHVAINTKDLEKSLVFYRDILGFKELNTVCTEEYSSTNLAVPGGSVVELIKKYEQAVEIPETDSTSEISHLAFDVKDVAAHEKILRDAGVEIVIPCTEMENFNTRVVQCKDPNGIVIALREDLK